MDKNTRINLIVLPFLIVVVLIAAYLNSTGKVSTPTTSVKKLFQALETSDLSVIAYIGLRHRLDKSIIDRGSSKYLELMSIFEEIIKKGEKEYGNFIKKIQKFGAQEFNDMSREERNIVDANIGKNKFIIDAGINKLPPEDRSKISDVEKFIKGEEKTNFCIREGLTEISHEKWEAVKNYNYSQMKNQRVKFIRDEGKRIIIENLQNQYADIEVSIGKLIYIDDFPGSLFNTTKVRVKVKLNRAKDKSIIGNLTIVLNKFRNNWVIESVYPPLF